MRKKIWLNILTVIILLVVTFIGYQFNGWSKMHVSRLNPHIGILMYEYYPLLYYYQDFNTVNGDMVFFEEDRDVNKKWIVSNRELLRLVEKRLAKSKQQLNLWQSVSNEEKIKEFEKQVKENSNIKHKLMIRQNTANEGKKYLLFSVLLLVVIQLFRLNIFRANRVTSKGK